MPHDINELESQIRLLMPSAVIHLDSLGQVIVYSGTYVQEDKSLAVWECKISDND